MSHVPYTAPAGAGRPALHAPRAASLARCAVLALSGLCAALAASAHGQTLFDPDADYDLSTPYGQETTVSLDDYVADGASVNAFAVGCDAASSDYYETAEVVGRDLRLQANRRGHLHGKHTESETVCTVTATFGATSQERAFRFVIPGSRSPQGLQSENLRVSARRPHEAHLHISGSLGLGRVMVRWRPIAGDGTWRTLVAQGVASPLVVPGLDAATGVEMGVALLKREAFDLYRDGRNPPPGTLIEAGSPLSEWLQNLGTATGKPARLSFPAVSIDDVTVAEAAGATATFTVSLGATGDREVTVTYGTKDGTAAEPTDYTSVTGTITLPAGHTDATVTVPVVDDSLPEPDETFTLALTDVAGAIIHRAGTGTITDDDEPPRQTRPPPPPQVPEIRIDDVSVAEAPGAVAAFRVFLDIRAPRDVTVDYVTSPGTALDGEDYGHASGTLTVPAGEAFAFIHVSILDDDVSEPDEVFSVRLSSPLNGRLVDDEGVATITDADLPRLSIDDVTVAEAPGAVAGFTVSLDVPSRQAVTANYTTVDGTALSGPDYLARSGTVTLDAGRRTAVIAVPVVDDEVPEPDERFAVRLSSPANAGIDDGEGVATITDPDLPWLSIGDVTVPEAPGSVATFPVTLDRPTYRTVTVRYETVDGTAVQRLDYARSAGQLAVPPGQTAATIPVPIVDDDVPEPDETFTVRLASPAGVRLADDEGLGTITDDAVVGAAKASEVLARRPPDTFEVAFAFTLHNLGPRPAPDVQLTDDLAAAFPGAELTLLDGPVVTGDLNAANPDYDGVGDTRLLSGAQTLPAGGRAEIALVVRIGGVSGPFTNQAEATWVLRPDGSRGLDLSDEGTDPDPNANGRPDDADEHDPTETRLDVDAIGLAKRAGLAALNDDGSFDVPLTFTLRNYGTTPLAGAQVEDDLRRTFGEGAQFSVTGPPVSPTLGTNANYDGRDDTLLLDGRATLDAGASATVTVPVRVRPHEPDTFLNAAGATATGQFGTAADASTDGEDPDPDGDGDPGNNGEPTPIRLAGAVLGTVFEDLDLDGVLDSGEPRLPDWRVDLSGPAGRLGNTTSRATGNYRFTDLSAGDYTLRFRHPDTGVVWGERPASLLDQVVARVDFPVVASGRVYDSLSRDPVAGVTIELVGPQGTPLPDACLLPGQQRQTTGTDGAYRLDPLPGAQAACPAAATDYRIRIAAAPDGHRAGASRLIPPEDAALDPATCPVDPDPGLPCLVQPQGDPPRAGEPATHFLLWRVRAGDAAVVHNHLPLDPSSASASGHLVDTVKRVRPGRAVAGDLLGYRIDVTNLTARNLPGLELHDDLPAGLTYVSDTAELCLADAAAAECDDPPTALVAAGHDPVRFGPLDLPPGATGSVRYLARVDTGAVPGPYTNTVTARIGGAPVGPPASATAHVIVDAVLEHRTIVGRVFVDRNANGLQDAGEEGVAAARLATVAGLLVEADAHGRYHLAEPDPATASTPHAIVKLDPRSLPAGTRVLSENPRVVRVTPGLMSRIDFAVSAPDEVAPVPAPAPQVAVERVVRRLHTRRIEPVRFESGYSYIPDGYLDRLRELIDGYRDAENLRVRFVGHTDTQPLSPRAQAIYGDNQGLSEARAEEVARWVAAELGLAADTIETEGHAYRRPVASNLTPEGMALNRRVEIEFAFDERETSTTDLLPPESAPESGTEVRHAVEVATVEPVRFAAGDATVTDDQAQALARNLGSLAGHDILSARVTGHTDALFPVPPGTRRCTPGQGLPVAPGRTSATAPAPAAILPRLFWWRTAHQPPAGPGPSTAREPPHRLTWLQTGNAAAESAQPPAAEAGADPASDLPADIPGASDAGIALERARNAARALAEIVDLPPDRITVASCGDTDPVADNATEFGRALNRRAEVEVTYRRVAEIVTTRPLELMPAQMLPTAAPPAGRLWLTEDALDPQAELDVLALRPVRVDAEGRMIRPLRFAAYANHGPFAVRYRLDLYRGDDTDLVRPLARLAAPTLAWPHAFEFFDAGLRLAPGQTLAYVLHAVDGEGREDATHLRLVDVTGPSGPNPPPVEPAAVRGQSNLATQRIPFSGSRVRVHGEDFQPGEVVMVGTRKVPVDRRGRFAADLLLPEGTHGVTVSGQRDGHDWSETLRPEVDDRYTFLVALANLSVGRRVTASRLEPLSAGQAGDRPLFVDGRLAFYAKAKILGRYLLTAQLDTTSDALDSLGDNLRRRDPHRIFRQLDPDRHYPVYGDDSTTVSDVDTQGALYVRLDFDRSQVLWGNFNTGLTDTRLTRYNRSLYGARVRHEAGDATRFGDPKRTFTAFASEPGSVPAQVAFRATGGSLYFLPHADIVVGSDKVWIEVRERDSRRVVDRQELLAGRDYEIDALQGRILLRRPLAHVVASRAPAIVRPRPFDGDEVHLLADYEHVPGDLAGDDLTVGARGRLWLGDRLAIGATRIGHSRSGDAELEGLDLTVKAGRGTYLSVERARSRPLTAGSRLVSTDGGLTFREREPSTPGNPAAAATAIDARVNLAETAAPADGDVRLWWHTTDGGFAAGPLASATDVVERGFDALVRPADDVLLRTSYADVDRGLARSDTVARVQVERRQGRLALGGEMRHESVSRPPLPGEDRSGADAHRALMGGIRLGYDLSEARTLYGTVQRGIDGHGAAADNDLVAAGLRSRLSETTAATVELSDGDRGGALSGGIDYAPAAGAGLRFSTGVGPGALTEFSGTYRLAEGHELYGTYAVDPDRTTPDRNLVTLGQRRDFGNRFGVFAESRFGELERRGGTAHTLGLDYTTDSDWVLSGLVTRADGDAAADPFRRQAISVGASLAADSQRFSSRLESRTDTRLANRIEQNVASFAYSRTVSENQRLLAKLNLAWTSEPAGSAPATQFVELDLGHAWRPAGEGRWRALSRYGYLKDVAGARPVPGPDQRIHILSTEALYRLSPKWEIGGGVAVKEGALRGLAATGDWHDYGVGLATARAWYHVTARWDVLIEYRTLFDRHGDNHRSGLLLGGYRQLHDHLKLGVGYNFTDFSHDLRESSYQHHGWFADLIGTF